MANNNNNNIVEYFQFNLYRLKNYINTNIPRTKNNEITLIIFNNIIDKFPDNKWFNIKDTFFDHTEYRTPDWLVTYTIISYNFGQNYFWLHPLFIEDLSTTLTIYHIKPYLITKYAEFFLKDPLVTIINQAIINKGIMPKYIIRLTLENFNLENITSAKEEEIIRAIKKFIDEYNFQIFNGNYNFFNIYHCLKKIWDNQVILELPDLNFPNIDLLLKFNEFPNEETIKKIQNHFAQIEQRDCSIKKKVEDSLTIIANYSYDLPDYLPPTTNFKQ